MQLMLQPRHRRQKLKQQLLQHVSCNICGTHSPHSGGFLASGDLQQHCVFVVQVWLQQLQQYGRHAGLQHMRVGHYMQQCALPELAAAATATA